MVYLQEIEHRRSAPESWGEWPPAQALFDAAAARALKAVDTLVRAMNLDDDPVVELWMHVPDRFARMQFSPGSSQIGIGAIMIPVLKLGWKIQWEPATDAGHLWEHHAGQDWERERLRDGMQRVADPVVTIAEACEVAQGAPAPNPACPLCGLEMRFTGYDGEWDMYHCDGAVRYDKWDRPILMPGRYPDDDHAHRSCTRIPRRRSTL